MKKLRLLTKSLLVAAGLLVGATSAWGQAMEWQIAWADYFEDVTQYTSNFSWPSTGNLTISQASRPDGVDGKYYYVYDNGGNGRVWTFSVGKAYSASGSDWSKYTFSSSEAYKLEFDIAFRSDRFNNSYGSDQLFTIPNLVSMTLPKASTTATFKAINAYAAGSIAANDELFTITAVYDYTNTGNVFANHFYHFVIESGSDRGTSLAVYGPYSTGSYSSTPVFNKKLSDSKIDIETLTGTVQRYYSSMGLDNVVLYKEVAAGSVEVPTAGITAVDGANRTVTFSCVTDGVTFSYSTNGGSSWTDADYVVINENTDLLVKATKGGNSATSATLSFLAGNTLVLNNPTITKRSYSAGNYIVRITSDQSGLEIDPNSLAAGSSVKYKIGDGATQTYSGDVNVPEGNTLTAWVEATGYTTSDEVECVTEARPVGAEVWTQDYTSVVAGTTNACGVVLSTTTGGDFTVDDTPYYNIVGYTKDAATVDVDLNTNIGLAVSTNFNLRNNGSNSGILQNGSNQNIGFQNLKVGDIIIITTNGNALSGGTGMTLLGNMSTTSEYVFRATATEGAVRFNWGTYAYVKTITVERATVSPAIGPDGYATYSSPYALDFEHATGVKGYYATSVSGNTAVMTKITGTAAAGEGLFLQKTDGEISIPVVTTGTTLTGNLLKATDGNAIPASTASIFNYVFAKQSDELGFYKVTADLSDVAKGKAYLQTTTALTTGVGARMAFSFEDETTGINAVQGSGLKVNGSETVYNLNGQRVAQSTKGLYIVNGKKVLVK